MKKLIISDLSARYTCKKFDSTKRISEEDIAILKEALRLSASSINSQPWKFIFLSSDEAKQRFHDTFEDNFQFNQPHAKEASHTILLAYNPRYTKADYKKVCDVEVSSGHIAAEMHDYLLNQVFAFVEMNSDETGFNGHWTKTQLYIALGNLLHTLARLGIDSTPMEGIDQHKIGEIFNAELDDYVCELAVSIGYHSEEDYNFGKPKARLTSEDVILDI